MSGRPAPGSRLAARLAAIDAAQTDLQIEDDAAMASDWTEASQFNLDARNDQWRRLEDERRVTLAA